MASTNSHEQNHDSDFPLYKSISQTLIPSPEIQWMLPAKLRDQHHMDVVIIREFSISLEEFRDNHLVELEAKTNFDSRVLSASVLETSPKSFVDAVVMQQHNGESSPSTKCPPQILLLCLASNYMLFVTVQTDESGTLAFVYSRRPLPGHKSETRRFGKHLSVNSEARVLACSSAQGHFGLFALKDAATEYRVDTLGPRRLPQLVREERFFLVDGAILNMDFIRSPKESKNVVQLVLLVSKGHETFVVAYTWRSQESLTHVSLDAKSPSALPSIDRNPLHLIPIRRPMSFILVLDHELALYTITAKGHWDRHRHSLKDERSNVIENDSDAIPWVQWARPLRNEGRQKNNDEFYLCRQDGLIRYIELQVEPNLGIDVHFDIGYLEVSKVGTGFTVMSCDYEFGRDKMYDDVTGGDVLLVAGDRTQGGVYNIEARKKPKCVQIIPNWAPVGDVLKLDPSDVDTPSEYMTSTLHDRLFVCGGNGVTYIDKEIVECGTVSELRYGHEAQIRYRISQPGSSSITGLWTLRDIKQQRIIFLMSVPERTLAAMVHFPIRNVNSNEPYDFADFQDAEEGTAYGMKADVETLAAGCTSKGLAVQVTPKGVCTVDFDAQADKKFHPVASTSSIVAATINEEIDMIVTCHKNDTSFALLLSRIEPDGTMIHASEPTGLPKQPTALHMQNINGRIIVVLGDGDGELAILEAGPEQRLLSQAKRNISADLCGSTFPAVNSIVILDFPNKSNPAILCGLRNGWLLYLSLHLGGNDVKEKESVKLLMKSQQQLGRTAIDLTIDSMNPHTAFVMCESNIFQFRRIYNETRYTDYCLFHIFLSNHLEERLRKRTQCQQRQHTVRAIARLPHLPAARMRDLGESVGCILDNELVFCQLSSGPKVVPRTIFIRGKPTQMAYSKRLRKIIATVEASSSENGQTCHTTNFEAIDPDDTSAARTMISPRLTQNVSQIMVWRPVVDKKEYEMMVIATNDDQDGWIHFYKPIAGSEPELKLNHEWSFPGEKIYQVASYGKSAIIYCVESVLELQALELPAKRWRKICKYKLPSPAIAITVSGTEQFIYVTTTRHSLRILTVQDERFKLLESSLEFLNASNQIETNFGIMISGKSRHGAGSIVGYNQPSVLTLELDEMTSTNTKAIRKLFESQVVRPISHFKRSDRIRSSQRDLGEAYYGTAANGTVYEVNVVRNGAR